MKDTYNPNQSISLESPDLELIVNFQPAPQGTVFVDSVQYYANDAKSLFYSLIRQGYSVI